jgi:ABC-2 type transport system ATP-binding protein
VRAARLDLRIPRPQRLGENDDAPHAAPPRGGATVLGCDSRHLTPDVRARVGYLAEGHPVYGWMRVRDAGRYQSRFYPRWNDRLFHAILDHFRVDPKTRAKNMSRGERAGLCLALALAPEPDLLILDDPAIGLDPVARRSLMESLVFATRKTDRTILFSSHLLSDIERMADHIAVLDYSVMRAQCSVETFQSCVQQFVLTFAADAPPPPRLRGLLSASSEGRTLRLTLANVTGETRAKLDELGAIEVEEVPLSLEEAFVRYMGGATKSAAFTTGDQEPLAALATSPTGGVA